jgi:hypothetical protein
MSGELETARMEHAQSFTFGGFLLNDSPSSSRRRMASRSKSFSVAHRSTAVLYDDRRLESRRNLLEAEGSGCRSGSTTCHRWFWHYSWS